MAKRGLSLELLDKPKYFEHPEVRKILRSSQHISVLKRLLRVSPPEEFSWNIEALHRLDSNCTRTLLSDEPLLSRLQIRKEHLAPMLNDSESELRLLTISLLSKCKEEPVDVERTDQQPAKQITGEARQASRTSRQ